MDLLLSIYFFRAMKCLNAFINWSVASDGANRIMVWAREKPLYPSHSQLACQSTCCFMEPRPSFLVTNWLIWKKYLSCFSASLLIVLADD